MSEIVLDAFRRMVPRPVDRVAHDDPFCRALVEYQIMNFPCWALPSPDHPALVCGVMYGRGVGEVWLVTGDGFEKSLRVVLPQLRQLCVMALSAFNLHRLHMMVDRDRPEAVRFARAMGFEFEATLKRIGVDGADQDVFLYAANERVGR